MSHLAVRIVADWLADATNGIAPITAAQTADTGDTLPSATVTVYDESRHGWLARLTVLTGDALTISYPAVLVTLQDGLADGGEPLVHAAGHALEGEVTIGVSVLVKENSSQQAAEDLMYYLRGARGSLLLLDQASAQSSRTRCGFRLKPSTTVKFGRLGERLPDTVMGGALLVTYPTIETTPVDP